MQWTWGLVLWYQTGIIESYQWKFRDVFFCRWNLKQNHSVFSLLCAAGENLELFWTLFERFSIGKQRFPKAFATKNLQIFFGPSARILWNNYMYLNMYFREKNYHQLRKPPLIDPQSELRGGFLKWNTPDIRKHVQNVLQYASVSNWGVWIELMDPVNSGMTMTRIMQ